MIKSNILSKTACCVWLVAMICSVSFVQAKERSELPVRRPFSNFAVGVNAGTVGFGASVATPLWSHISLRGGFSVAPFSYSYTYDDFDFSDILSEIPDPSTSVADLNVELGLKAELQMTSAHLLFDIAPFRRGNSSFFISAGLYFGTGKLITVSGRFDDAAMQKLTDCGVNLSDIPVEIGDVEAKMNPDGSVSADLKVRSVKPYVGIGFGRAIPRRRVGFRFELGALFHGKPEIVSNNISDTNSEELSDVNKFLKDFKVYPQINFQVTVRLLKDKAGK